MSSRKRVATAIIIPDLVEKHLIGLWRFRELGEPLQWCATYHYRGYFFDVRGYDNPNDTIAAVLAAILELRRGR